MIDVEMLRPTADEMLSGLKGSDAMRRAIVYRATAIDQLPKIADEMLGGLQKTPALRHRILLAAERHDKKKQRMMARRPAMARMTPAMSMALALCLMFGLGYIYGNRPQQAIVQSSPVDLVGMDTYAAGGLQEVGIPGYQSLFAGEGANPPLIGINNRYYRMLTSPLSVPESLVGSAFAEIQEQTDEPSLASVVGVISNIVPAGTPVYEVEGISHKTACIADVGGSLRLFQRVSYASNATIGNEMLEDTLSIMGRVKALELSGVGIVQDETKANELIYMLSEFAAYAGSDVPSGDQALTIYLKNGLSLQLQVQDDVLGACGSWACPEFFDSFAEEVAK